MNCGICDCEIEDVGIRFSEVFIVDVFVSNDVVVIFMDVIMGLMSCRDNYISVMV